MSSPLRLRSPRDIRAVFDARNARGTGTVVVHAQIQREPGPARVTVVAGKKVGGAVVRNRAKRRMRAALVACDLPDGIDVVVTAKPAAASAPFDTLTTDLEHGIRSTTHRALRR